MKPRTVFHRHGMPPVEVLDKLIAFVEENGTPSFMYMEGACPYNKFKLVDPSLQQPKLHETPVIWVHMLHSLPEVIVDDIRSSWSLGADVSR